MKKEYIYYAICGLAVVIVGTVGYLNWSGGERLMPPPVLEQRVVEGDSPVVRRQAAQQLARHGFVAQEEIRRALATSYKPQQPEQNDPEVVVPLLQAAMKAHDWQSMPTIFDAMEDPDPKIRGRAGAAARDIMGADFGFRAMAPPAERAKIIQEMRREYERMKQFYPNTVYADQWQPTGEARRP